MHQDLLIHTEAGVTTITFNRVEKKNSFTEAMYAQLTQALTAADADAATRVLVFQGDVTGRCRSPSLPVPAGLGGL